MSSTQQAHAWRYLIKLTNFVKSKVIGHFEILNMKSIII